MCFNTTRLRTVSVSFNGLKIFIDFLQIFNLPLFCLSVYFSSTLICLEKYQIFNKTNRETDGRGKWITGVNETEIFQYFIIFWLTFHFPQRRMCCIAEKQRNHEIDFTMIKCIGAAEIPWSPRSNLLYYYCSGRQQKRWCFISLSISFQSLDSYPEERGTKHNNIVQIHWVINKVYCHY